MTEKSRLAVFRIALVWALSVVVVVSTAAMAAISLGEKPRPPCGVETFPPYPVLDAPPAIVLWRQDELKDWNPPPCTAWQGGAPTFVVGLAGRFRDPGDVDALLARIGAISSLRDVRYWSITDRQWNAMFVRANALDGPDPKKPRGDFSASEMHAGHEVYFLAADNRSRDEAVSRLRVREADSGHIIIEASNVTPLRWMFVSFAAPGNVQTWYFLDREAGGSWRFYSLTRVLYASSLFARFVSAESYLNRAAAIYRHFAGIPTDRDPPPAL